VGRQGSILLARWDGIAGQRDEQGQIERRRNEVAGGTRVVHVWACMRLCVRVRVRVCVCVRERVRVHARVRSILRACFHKRECERACTGVPARVCVCLRASKPASKRAGARACVGRLLVFRYNLPQQAANAA